MHAPDRSTVPRARAAAAVAAAALVLSSACDQRAGNEPIAPGAPISIESPAPITSNTPALHVYGDSTIWLTWTERRTDSSLAIRVVARRSGQWDTVRTVTEGRPFFANWADFPSVTVLNNGALAAHWLEREATGKYAYGVRVVKSLDQAVTWSAPITPHTDGLAAEHGFVTMWPDGPDGLGLAWLDGRKSAMPDSAREMTVRTATITADGRLQREAQLDARSCDCCQVASGATRGGHVVVYRDRSTTEIRDIVAVRRQGDAWSAPVAVHRDEWHYAGCPVNGPSVATRGDSVAVAWFTAANDTSRVLVALSIDGGANFQPPVRVDDGDPIGRAMVVFDRAGDVVVGSMERVTPETAEIRVRRVSTGKRSPFRTVAATSAARASGFPKMVVIGDTLVVAWTATQPTVRVQLAQLPLLSRTLR